MPPPPASQAQAGKFKPRKPAKKIVVGETTTPSSGADNIAPMAVGSSSAVGRGGSGGGRGRGRGGRGVTPQGRVFFTGQPDPGRQNRSTSTSATGASLRTTAGAASASTGTTNRNTRVNKSEGGANNATKVQEEIVGELEEAVGVHGKGSGSGSKLTSRNAATTNVSGSDRFLDNDDENNGLFRTNAMTSSASDYYYESDSSAENEYQRNKSSSSSRQRQRLQPQQEPKEPLTLPVVMRKDRTDNESITKSVLDLLEEQQQQKNHPAADSSSSWFLFQLPTRLPPLCPKIDPISTMSLNTDIMVDTTTTTMAEEDGNDFHGTAISGNTATTTTVQHTESIVSTAPVDMGAFDNALVSARSGRLGTLKFHASGKVVLDLQDGDGVVWNVREGLSCGFLQKAVCIDLQESQYVPLGHVQTTLVATPDLSKAFASSSTTSSPPL